MSFTANGTGGEYYHRLTVSELPSHVHQGLDIDGVYVFGWDTGNLTGFDFMDGNYMKKVGNRITTGSTGDNNYHNNIQPYVVTYFWRRTA